MTEPFFIEVVKVEDGMFVDPQPHIDRIIRTTMRFFAEPLTVQLIKDMIPINLRTGVVKCRIVYSKEVASIDFEEYEMRNIRSLSIIEDNTIDYGFKYLNREAINKLFSQRGDCDDILIVKNSLITDTSYSNVVFKNFRNELYTPASTLLSGTKRQKLLNAGIIHEKEIRVNDIQSYEGVYLINAMIDIEDELFVGVDSIF
ncbi:MAG: aminotransferase class IV [Dysgonamonadaceae bacterium]|nr:aminotransferase class IV [Dysgonamonadaceae bacterium]MDD3356968.1 aminotransferase class IV [Dysgonamonadaceae bacterium]HUI33070.1 aminotransferase class IV [Dysgonamonadaceae bacterium]